MCNLFVAWYRHLDSLRRLKQVDAERERQGGAPADVMQSFRKQYASKSASSQSRSGSTPPRVSYEQAFADSVTPNLTPEDARKGMRLLQDLRTGPRTRGNRAR
mmetsp:Transcript_3820/g.9700  ORF Transcript_3820/g.9700 Transcript_3820/m.9700 type:complete len:103 (+) Transcript_3820:98-406(+)